MIDISPRSRQGEDRKRLLPHSSDLREEMRTLPSRMIKSLSPVSPY